MSWVFHYGLKLAPITSHRLFVICIGAVYYSLSNPSLAPTKSPTKKVRLSIALTYAALVVNVKSNWIDILARTLFHWNLFLSLIYFGNLTLQPTKLPTKFPTKIPTNSPSTRPSPKPTLSTTKPTFKPVVTTSPTRNPSKKPTSNPTFIHPSLSPVTTINGEQSSQPTQMWSLDSTLVPTSKVEIMLPNPDEPSSSTNEKGLLRLLNACLVANFILVFYVWLIHKLDNFL